MVAVMEAVKEVAKVEKAEMAGVSGRTVMVEK